MDKIKLNSLVKPLVNIYDEIELEIIKDIVERLSNYSDVSGSLEWYIDKIASMNSLDDNTKKIIKSHKKEISKAVRKITNDIVSDVDGFGRLEKYYNDGLIEFNPKDLYNSPSIINLMNEAIKDVDSINVLIQTKAIEKTNSAYMNILNKAYIETASGVYTYQESIRRSLKKFAKEGIQVATYNSGREISIEAVVRRDVITRINKLVGAKTLEACKQSGTNLVYVDQHLGARVRNKYMKHYYEAHADWQGKVYKIDEYNPDIYPHGLDKYEDFYEKTGYGEMLGLKGLNCYHDFRAFYKWEKIPNKIDEAENKEKYELFQTQRAYERKIRELKRYKEISKFDEDKTQYDKYKNRLNDVNKEYDKFLKDNNLRRDYSREYVANQEFNFDLHLNEAEKDSIQNYLSSDSYKLNESLRNDTSLDGRLNDINYNLSKALSKIPSTKGMYNRSLFFSNETEKTKFIDTMQEEVIKFKGFTSMSKKIYDDTDDVRLIIHSKNAKDLTKLNQNEQEFLLDKNSEFKVLSSWDENDKIFYELEEL